jgi:hypothetical protein
MFEGLFQPMHLLIDRRNRFADLWSQETARARKRHGRRHPRIQIRDAGNGEELAADYRRRRKTPEEKA